MLGYVRQQDQRQVVTTDHLPDRVTGKDGKGYPMLRVTHTGEMASQSPTRARRRCLDCGHSVPVRGRNGYCSDVCRLRHRKARRADMLERILPDDPGRAE